MRSLFIALCLLGSTALATVHTVASGSRLLSAGGKFVVAATNYNPPTTTNYLEDVYSNNLLFEADAFNDLHYAMRDLSTNEWGFQKMPIVSPPTPVIVGTNMYGQTARGWLLNGAQGWELNSSIARGAFTHLAAVGADTSYTFACWVKITNSAGGCALFSKCYANNPNFEYCGYIWGDLKVKWVHGNLGGHLTNSMAVWTQPIIQTDTWHHLVFSYTPGYSNEGMRIYVDGVQQATTNQNLMPDAGYVSMQAGGSVVNLASGIPNVGQMKGYYFDPRMYSGAAWSSNMVTNAYAATIPTNWRVAPIDTYITTNWVDPYGVVAIWNFNASNGVYYTEPKGGFHATNATAGDGPYITLVATNSLGEVNYSAYFDGTNDYQICPDSDLFTPNREGTETGFTITAWINLDSYGDNSSTIWSRFQNPYESAFWISAGKGYARLFDPANSFIDGGSQFNSQLTNWTFTAVTYTGSKTTNGWANYYELWRGNTLPTASGVYGGVSNRAIVTYIGRYYGASATLGVPDGQFDEIRYYTNCLTPAAIRRIFWQTCPTQHYEVIVQ